MLESPVKVNPCNSVFNLILTATLVYATSKLKGATRVCTKTLVIFDYAHNIEKEFSEHSFFNLIRLTNLFYNSFVSISRVFGVPLSKGLFVIMLISSNFSV